MRTLSLKQARKALGVKSTVDESKKILDKLTVRELKFLAKNHRIKLKSKVEEGFLTSTVIAPSRRQYINALAKELSSDQIAEEIKAIPKAETKKKRRKRSNSYSLF